MQKHKLRSRMARAAAFGAAGLAATLVMGTGVAYAGQIPSDPAGGATPVAPHFYNGNVEGIRDTGSDTTIFMMQKIGDLYTGAGLYGCTLNSSAGQTLYNSSDPASASGNEEEFCQSGQNVATTDVNDNWDRTEVTEGVDDVGSGAGQSQLCAALSTPLPVDFSRSSKPAGSACSDMVETGYAKDGVPIIAYPVNPSSFGTSTIAPYDAINGGVVGPVQEGWLPGDPTAGPYTGSELSDISNVDNGGGVDSTAYRLWCQAGGPVDNQITDWGQLTNLGPTIVVTNVGLNSGTEGATDNGVSGFTPDFPTQVVAGDAVSGNGIPSGTLVSSVSGASMTLSNNATVTTSTGTLDITTTSTQAEGQGFPVGIPVRIMGVNTASGTEATFTSYASSGVSGGGGCSANMDTDAGNDPNPATAPSPNSQHIALENNSDQLDQFATADFPSPDYADQAIEVATSLYIESNGVFNTNPYAAATTIHGQSFSGVKLTENGGILPTTANLLSNEYPTARTLFNIYRTSTVRASTGGFLNWICDGDVNFQKNLDNSTGKSFDTELGTIIGTTNGFPRLTDESSPPSNGGTPADGQPAPNTTCEASLSVNATNGSDDVTLVGGGNFPPDIPNAGALDPPSFPNVGVSGTGFPTGDYVSSGGGTATLVLNAPFTGTTGTTTITLTGVPPVTKVAFPQS